jgi:ABC-type branched-subunit amino acid transport system substrate-binding protein
LDVETAAISFTNDDDFTFFNYKLGVKYLNNVSTEVLQELASKRQETNFASQVAAIRASRADLVVISHQPDDGGKFILQLRERGIKTQITDTGYTVAGRDYWNLSKGFGKGSIGGSIYNARDSRPIVQNWVKLWRSRTGKTTQDPDPYETSTYDSVKFLAAVLNNAKSLGRKDIADAFMTVQNLEGVSGVAKFRKQELPDIYREKPVLVQLGDNGQLLPWP